MKLTILLSIITMSCFLSILSAQNNVEALIGSWEFNLSISETKMQTETKLRLESSPTQKTLIEQLYKKRKVIFSDDGSYEQILLDGRISKGEWKLDNDTIYITDTNGYAYKQKIEVLTESHLVLIPIVDEGIIPYMPEWHFLKL